MGENSVSQNIETVETRATERIATADEDKKSPATTGSSSKPLDETWYYYQNPTTGDVSKAPLSVRQLCRLLCPVREGMKPILPPHTRCLQQNDQSFGEWKLASELEVLREASCAQWYTSAGGGASPEGPFSCRTLWEKTTEEEETSDTKILLVYAKDVTPEWIAISEFTNLQLVLQSLTTATTITNNNDKNVGEKGEEASTIPEDAKKVQDELEAFLSSTANDMHTKDDDGGGGDDDDHSQMYESDGGTKYVRDPLTGNWIHEALAPQPPPLKAKPTPKIKVNPNSNKNPKKSKKAKFSKRNAKHWCYVTGLPSHGVTTEDMQKYFSKAGLLDLDPETLQPKIKLYKQANGLLKGDASICYARPESVDLALQILDESPWDAKHIIRIQRATFQAKEGAEGDDGSGTKRKKKHVSEAKRKVARLALLQAQDEGFGERLAGGRKGLRIVVVKHMMEGIQENRLEDEIQDYCQEHGQVEKITCIEKSKVVIVKFVEPTAAATAVQAWNGMVNRHTKRRMEAIYWDGVTDYTHKEDNPEEEEKRHEEFGKWLETQAQELPPELRLQVAEE